MKHTHQRAPNEAPESAGRGESKWRGSNAFAGDRLEPGYGLGMVRAMTTAEITQQRPGMFYPVAFTAIVRDMLSASCTGLTHGDIRKFLLGADIAVEDGEISSYLSKELQRGSLVRTLVPRPAGGLGRRLVWRYSPAPAANKAKEGGCRA